MLGGPSSHPSSEATKSPSPLQPQEGLQKYLSEHFRISTDRVTGSRLQFHVVSDHFLESDWKEQSLPSSFISTKEYLKTRHLIFVSQFQPAHLNSPGSTRLGDASVIVMGLCAVEYASRGTEVPARCYIQYVDTTGLVKPRSLQSALTRSLLNAYFCYARDILQVSFAHLFASPKPSLLFAGSESHGRKAVLNGKQLISWWLALLTETFIDDSQVQTSIYAYSPSEELHSSSTKHTRQCIEKLNSRYESQTLRFQYGLPYRGADSALEVVPAFQDDPKWRHLEALLDAPGESRNSRKRQKRDPAHSDLTVREFFETLGIRSDFAKDHSALICVQFHDHNSTMSCDSHYTRRSDAATSILSLLKTLTFETDSEATRSSSRLIAILKMTGTVAYPVAHGFTDENSDPSHCNRFKEIISSIHPSDVVTSRFDTADDNTPVSDLQSFIKRKVPRGSV